jgi:hypothetical protein
VAPEARSWAALGGREAVAARASSGRLEVGDGADSRGPLDRETRERRPARKP